MLKVKQTRSESSKIGKHFVPRLSREFEKCYMQEMFISPPGIGSSTTQILKDQSLKIAGTTGSEKGRLGPPTVTRPIKSHDNSQDSHKIKINPTSGGNGVAKDGPFRVKCTNRASK